MTRSRMAGLALKEVLDFDAEPLRNIAERIELHVRLALFDPPKVDVIHAKRFGELAPRHILTLAQHADPQPEPAFRLKVPDIVIPLEHDQSVCDTLHRLYVCKHTVEKEGQRENTLSPQMAFTLMKEGIDG